MKKLLLLSMIALSLSCSSDDDKDTQGRCEGLFIHNITGETMHQPTASDGSETPEGYTFVECIEPEY